MIRNRTRPPFEYQRQGPIARPTGHKPDVSLGINIRPKTKNNIKPSTAPNNARTPRRISVKRKTANILDSIYLLELLNSTDLSSIQFIEASGKKLTEVDIESLKELASLEKADFSDNKLPLEPFSVISTLKDLDLSCNSIKIFDYKSSESYCDKNRGWDLLQNLNLSFNYASSFINELQFIPHLANLNLSNNSISELPSNLMHFTCLTKLNLCGNLVNSDQSFYALGTISSLQILILDDNQIKSIPKPQFGFESLKELSVKRNLLEYVDDVSSLVDFPALEKVNITNNPIVLRSKMMKAVDDIFEKTKILIITEEKPNRVQKRALPVNVRTVNFDPLTLPSFTKGHLRALNKNSKKIDRITQKPKERAPEEEEKDELVEHFTPKAEKKAPEDNSSFFLTATNATGSNDEEKTEVTQLVMPIEEEEEEEIEVEQKINSIWSEVPVVDASERLPLNNKRSQDFMAAFRKLEFIISHPDVRIKPRESASKPSATTIQVREETTVVEPPNLLSSEKTQKTIVKKKQKDVTMSKLAARTEYTKTEVQQMLRSMAERLRTVERDLHSADETGMRAVDIALEQKNFTTLQKQYETIRAELINTLNS